MRDRLRVDLAANPAVQIAQVRIALVGREGVFALLAARGYTAFTRRRHNVALRRG